VVVLGVFLFVFHEICVQLSVTLLPLLLRLHRRGISRPLVQNYSGCQGARGCIPGSFFFFFSFAIAAASF
jgi:hypothetical protein